MEPHGSERVLPRGGGDESKGGGFDTIAGGRVVEARHQGWASMSGTSSSREDVDGGSRQQAGDRRQGAGWRRQGTGGSMQQAGDKELDGGDRGQGAGDRELDGGDRELDGGDRGQGAGGRGARGEEGRKSEDRGRRRRRMQVGEGTAGGGT
eukprot:652706-Hanusia_phi.AAC.1